MAFIKPYREKPAPLAREIICGKCGEKFYTRKFGQGKTKYCVVCRAEVIAEQQRESIRRYNEKLRLRKQGVRALNSPTSRP